MPDHSAPSAAPQYDLVVIGGGINGSGIAADAAGRGLKVLLCEQDDLAQHTSSASSKLIHGGLRYLEHYEFGLVRKALAEREILLANAPHLIEPLRFILPHQGHLRPAWMIRVGLFLYDHLAGRQRLPSSKSIRFEPNNPLKAEITRGFSYYDCRVDDARLVIANAQLAREHGATILTRTRCVAAERHNGQWQVQLHSQVGQNFAVQARAFVNAAGPWVESLLRKTLQQPSQAHIRLVQGSHLIVPALYSGEHAYILQNNDGRIVFVIPYLGRFSLIGTTDRDYQGDPAQVIISDQERDYLLSVVNQHFKQQINCQSIISSFSGVRALLEDQAGNPAAVTRDYHLECLGTADQGVLLSVFGGKLTTYRTLAEAVLAKLAPAFPNASEPWTKSAALPGGEQGLTATQIAAQLQQHTPWLEHKLALRWAQAYGSNSFRLLENCRERLDLGEHFGEGLYAREVDYLCEHEWAVSAEDILWRRSKLGLFMSAAGQHALSVYLAARAGN